MNLLLAPTTVVACLGALLTTLVSFGLPTLTPRTKSPFRLPTVSFAVSQPFRQASSKVLTPILLAITTTLASVPKETPARPAIHLVAAMTGQ